MQEREPTIQELIDEWVENRDGRYMLVGLAEDAVDGRAIIFDTATGMVGGIEGDDDLHREVVQRMLRAGTKVIPKVPASSPDSNSADR